MKLSQLTTDQALDALCQLTPAISGILEDESVMVQLTALLPEKGKEVEEDMTGTGMRMMAELGKLAPVLLRDHREDVYSILSVLNSKEPEEIAAQNLLTTMGQVREAFMDRELLAFFRSSVGQAVTG